MEGFGPTVHFLDQAPGVRLDQVGSGFEPEVDLATGVRRTAAWYRGRDLL